MSSIDHTRPAACRPQHIATERGTLFAVHHVPAGRSPASTGVVCCYPSGQEYLRAHRAFSQLALRLSREGAHVLRFDYHGTGDSSGQSHDGALERWTADILAAVDWLRAVGDVTRISLVGLRLGATLATRAALCGGGIDRLVLWEPVVSGRSYLGEVAGAHRALLLDRGVDAHGPELTGSDEILGFPMRPALRRDIESVDLLALPKAPAPHVLLVEQHPRAELEQLARTLEALGARVDQARAAEPRVWERGLGDKDQSLIPPQTLDHIVRWFRRDGS